MPFSLLAGRATFLTWLRAFNGPCLWACLGVAFFAGGAAGFAAWRVASWKYGSEVATAKADLSAYRADVLRVTVDGQVAVAERQKAAAEATATAIREGLEVLHGEVRRTSDRAALARIETQLEELHHDPRFECRRLPLTDSYIDSLRIPAE
jgi:hypothetical protein